MNEGLQPVLSSEGHLFKTILDRRTNDPIPTYEDLKGFLRFLDKYVSHVVGTRGLAKFYRMYPSCVILDKLTDSDIAYAILVYENGFDVWSEDAKVRLMSSEDKDVYDKTAVQKYHVKKGTRLRVYMDGWLPEGRAHHDNMKVSVQKLRMETHFWDNLRDYWRIYVKENHKFAYEKGKITSTEDPDNGDEEEQGAVLFDFPLEPVPLPACEEERLC